MGRKRIGLGNWERLVENLKRNWQMSGSSLTANNFGNGYGTFGAPPIVLDDDSTVADGGDTEVVIHDYPDGLRLHVTNIAGQSVLIPQATTTGMDYAYDQTNDQGVQWVASMNTHKGTLDSDRFKVGTSKAFFVRLKFNIADVSGTDDCLIGFRKVEADQAAVDSYDEFAALNVISGRIKSETRLNAGTTATNAVGDSEGVGPPDSLSDWADGETHELRVNVDAGGQVTYKIDAVDCTGSFTFDDGEVVTPFFYYINAAHLSDTVILEEVEWGLQ